MVSAYEQYMAAGHPRHHQLFSALRDASGQSYEDVASTYLDYYQRYPHQPTAERMTREVLGRAEPAESPSERHAHADPAGMAR